MLSIFVVLLSSVLENVLFNTVHPGIKRHNETATEEKASEETCWKFVNAGMFPHGQLFFLCQPLVGPTFLSWA